VKSRTQDDVVDRSRGLIWVYRPDADLLPFDDGRACPLDFEQQPLYTQHWSEDELERFIEDEAWLSDELIELVRKSV
jgi:hypothetical protein